MDKEKLKRSLLKFEEACAKKGYPLLDTCLDVAFPAGPETSYMLKVKAKWVDGMTCSKALRILIDIMWTTMVEKERRHIFAIVIHDSNDEFHCEQEVIGVPLSGRSLR